MKLFRTMTYDRSGRRCAGWFRAGWFCAALFCLLATVPGARGEDEPKQEELRKSLVAAYEKTVAIHRAWSAAVDPDIEDAAGSHEIEIYREGNFMGLSFRADGSEFLVIASRGDVLVLSQEVDGTLQETIAPGARWLNRSYLAWVAATDFLNELLGTQLSRPQTYSTYFDFGLGDKKLIVSLSVSGRQEEQAGWLDPDRFQGEATTTEKLVTIKTKDLAVAYRRSDGTIQTVARDEDDGQTEMLLEPTQTRRAPLAWKRQITRLCGAALVKPGDGYDTWFQNTWCAAHLTMFLENDRKLLQHPNRLKSVVATLLSVLCSSDRVDAWLTLSAREEYADREKATRDAATVIFDHLWESVQSDLGEAQPPFSEEEQEQVRVLLWSEVYLRTQAVFVRPAAKDADTSKK